MSDDTNRKRAYVASLYSGPRWKKRVNKMSDAQVIAIYLKEKAKEDTPKPKKEGEDEIPF